MIDPTADDATLVDRARSGCLESFATLAARHQVAVVRYAEHLLGRLGGRRARCDAEDVVQQTFLRMFRALRGHRSDGPFAAWLFAIARRTCLNHLRAERRHADRVTRVTPRCGPARPDELAAAAEGRVRLWDIARRELPERQFTSLWLHYAEGMPVAAIAIVLERSPAAVKLLLHRGRRRLEPFVVGFDAERACDGIVRERVDDRA